MIRVCKKEGFRFLHGDVPHLLEGTGTKNLHNGGDFYIVVRNIFLVVTRKISRPWLAIFSTEKI